MLSPSRVKFRKVHKGRMRGQAKGGTEVSYGDFGLQALECGWLTVPHNAARLVYLTASSSIAAARSTPCAPMSRRRTD